LRVSAKAASPREVWEYVTRTLTNLDDVRAAKIDNLDALISSRMSNMYEAKLPNLDNLDMKVSDVQRLFVHPIAVKPHTAPITITDPGTNYVNITGLTFLPGQRDQVVRVLMWARASESTGWVRLYEGWTPKTFWEVQLTGTGEALRFYDSGKITLSGTTYVQTNLCLQCKGGSSTEDIIIEGLLWLSYI
jgi:hypothetical protein